MKYLTKPKFNVNLYNRKYRMILIEVFLFVILLMWTNAINAFFPVSGEVIREGDYTFYILFSFMEIIILGTMFFVGGHWFASWRQDKQIWKDDPTEP